MSVNRSNTQRRVIRRHTDLGHERSKHERWAESDRRRIGLRASLAGVLDATEQNVSTMVRCVSLSGPLAGVWENADSVRACEEARIASRDALGLGIDQLNLLLVAIAKGFREASAIFKVPSGGSDRIHQVLARALEQLSLEESGDSFQAESKRDHSKNWIVTPCPEWP